MPCAKARSCQTAVEALGGVMAYRDTIHSTAGTMFCCLVLHVCQVALAAPIASVLLSGALAAQPLPQSVLILDQYAASLPWVGARTARSGLCSTRIVGARISIYEEHLILTDLRVPNTRKA